MNVNPKEIIERGIVIGIDNPEEQIQPNGIDLRVSDSVLIEPGCCCNVAFIEKVKIPQNLLGVFQVRSSFSRRGVFTSSGIWDTGYEGVTGCTIYNLSKEDISIERGTRIGQMVFFRSESENLYSGHYNRNNEVKSKYER